jgi:hypothetical protein
MRRIQRARLWTGLALLGAMVVVGREAQADLPGITITGSGGTVPGTDPQFFIELTFTINPTFEMVPGHDSFTVSGFKHVTEDSLESSPAPPSPFQISHFHESDDDRDLVTDITWTVSQAVTAGVYQPFFIYTEDLTSPPGPVTLTYSAVLNKGTIDQPATGNGSGSPVTIDFTAVPEPSTLIFLVSAAAVTPIAILVKRSRRRASAAL